MSHLLHVKQSFVMEVFAQMLLGVAVFYLLSQKTYVECQTASAQEPKCNDNTTCPCCSVPCPSDGSGQCGENCKDGYHSGKCWNICPYNCIRCVDAQQGGGVSNCTLCRDGYYSTESLYQCQSACSSNCKTCKSTSFHCTSCYDGYYMNSTHHCNRCESNCTSCIDGYYLNLTDASCNRCDSNCYSCKTSQSCSCYNGCNDKNIKEGICLNDTNQCLYGCKPNFNSSDGSTEICDVCMDNKFGVDCDLNCSAHCKDDKCERLTGNCFECKDGFYGETCEMNCSKNCQLTCDKNSGQCESCKNEFYGKNCTQTCATNCTRCEQITGTCTSCKDGFYGFHCTKLCPGNCKDGCNMSNGHCVSCKTGLTGVDCNTPFTSTTLVTYVIPGDSSTFLAPAVGGTVSAVLVIVIVIVLAVFLFRRRSASTFKGNFNVINLDDYNLARTDVLEENDEFDPTYFTCRKVDKKKPCGKLAVNDLAQFVDSHGEEFYQEEFLKLPRGLIKPCEDAKLEKNIIKNRYTGIYPYDEHRVKLLPPGSDFINACYIDGFKTKKE